ncbi:hypothetical protein MMC22_000712 [Lobaria immixta]|nr:hypothetical protein [Lobaria immixta]
MSRFSTSRSKTYIVEHLDPELGPWSALEYLAIAKESEENGAIFCLSSVAKDLTVPQQIQNVESTVIETRSVEELYGKDKSHICLLDPAATNELSPDDGTQFDIFLFGGILGDDPPRDRTSELRKKGFHSRRLGPVQMTTDTAVRVTRTIVQQKVFLADIIFIDNPELRIDQHESTEMPFRYMADEKGLPIMPDVGFPVLLQGPFE